MPWIEKLWDTPNVAHDNPSDQRFHASLMLGFADTDAVRSFFGSEEIATLSGKLPEFVSAVHAYEVSEVLTLRQGRQDPPARSGVAAASVDLRAPGRTSLSFRALATGHAANERDQGRCIERESRSRRSSDDHRV